MRLRFWWSFWGVALPTREMSCFSARAIRPSSVWRCNFCDSLAADILPSRVTLMALNTLAGMPYLRM